MAPSRPFLAVAQQLQATGHRITFAGMATQQKMVEGNGFTFVPLPQSSKKQAQYSDHAMTAMTLAMMFCDDQLIEVPAILADVQPDRVVIDCMMFGCQVALQAAALKGTTLPPISVLFHSTLSGCSMLEHLPLAFLNHARQQEGLEPMDCFSEGGTLLTLLNNLRQTCGMAPITTSFEQWESFVKQVPGSRALIASIPELDTPEYADKVQAMPEGTFVYIGAQIPRADKPIHIHASFDASETATTASA